MLLRNYSINIATLRSTGGLAVRSSLAPWSSSHNMYLSEASYPLTASTPSGTEAPYSFVLAPKGGEMSSTTSVFGNGDVSGSLTLGKSFTANLSGDGNLSGGLGLLTALASSLSGSGDLAGSLGLSLSMIADLSGSGSLSGSLGLQVPFFANLSGFGEVTGNLKGNASLSATIYVNTGQASTEELKDAIWNALSNQFLTPGTMAYDLLNASGGGGGGATPAQIWEYANRTLTESAGLSTEEHNKLFSLENSTGGGGFSSQAIQTSISNAKREIIEKMEEIPSKIPQVSLENIETTLSEIDSHNSLATEEIINTIKSESNEVSSDIIRKTKELKEDNITTRNLVRQKTKKLDENVSKLADRQDKTDKMIEDEADEIESEIEKILNEEADMIENEIYNKEADEIEKDITNQSNDGNSESNS